MIKAIIFDFGNVICTFDNNIFLQGIAKFTNKSIEELNDIIYKKSGLPRKYETGLMSSDEFYTEICKLCDLTVSKVDFIELYSNIFFPIETTFDLIKKLSGNYKLALLSNTSEIDFEYGIKRFDVIKLFDTVSLSYIVGEMKPGEKLFKDALEKLKLKPEECVYVDDIEQYAQTARRMGIHGFHYTSSQKFLDDLKNLNVSV